MHLNRFNIKPVPIFYLRHFPCSTYGLYCLWFSVICLYKIYIILTLCRLIMLFHSLDNMCLTCPSHNVPLWWHILVYLFQEGRLMLPHNNWIRSLQIAVHIGIQAPLKYIFDSKLYTLFWDYKTILLIFLCVYLT